MLLLNTFAPEHFLTAVKIMSITYALMIYPGDVDQTRVAERRQHPQPPYVYIFFNTL